MVITNACSNIKIYQDLIYQLIILYFNYILYTGNVFLSFLLSKSITLKQTFWVF